MQNSCQIRHLINWLPSVCIDSQVSDTPELPSAGATPTTSKKKLLNWNKVVREDVETGS